jgi:hypothetical protein
MVERNDPADHAERLAHGKVQCVRTHRDRRSFHLGDKAGIEIELRRARLGVAHHLGIGVAAIGGVDHGEFLAIPAQHLGNRPKHLGAIERGHAPPFPERGLRRRDRGLRVRD